MTTDMFSGIFNRAKAAFRGQRPAPVQVAVPVNVQTSSTVGLPVAVQPVPAAMPTQWVPPTEIPLGPKPADLETIDLRGAIRLDRPPIRIGTHATEESKVMRGPASLVGSL